MCDASFLAIICCLFTDLTGIICSLRIFFIPPFHNNSSDSWLSQLLSSSDYQCHITPHYLQEYRIACVGHRACFSKTMVSIYIGNYCSFISYSIPLNNTPKLSVCTEAPRCRTNMVQSALSRYLDGITIF